MPASNANATGTYFLHTSILRAWGAFTRALYFISLESGTHPQSGYLVAGPGQSRVVSALGVLWLAYHADFDDAERSSAKTSSLR